MSAAQEAYDRLMAARRIVTPEEKSAREKDDVAERQRARINRKLARVY